MSGGASNRRGSGVEYDSVREAPIGRERADCNHGVVQGVPGCIIRHVAAAAPKPRPVSELAGRLKRAA